MSANTLSCGLIHLLHTYSIKKRVAPLWVFTKPEYDSHDIGRIKKAASDPSAVTSFFGVLYVLVVPASNGTFFLGRLAESLLAILLGIKNSSEWLSKFKVSFIAYVVFCVTCQIYMVWPPVMPLITTSCSDSLLAGLWMSSTVSRPVVKTFHV